MMLEELKKTVYEANELLPKLGLVTFTWGNVSGIDREKGLFVIKPSGVPYEKLRPEDMVVVDLDGHVVEGELNPSSDTMTHAVLYRAFPSVGGIVHAHSPWAVSFAQAGIPIEAMGTTHADTFYGDVPVTDALTKEEIESAYEENTGKVIVRRFAELGLDPAAIPRRPRPPARPVHLGPRSGQGRRERQDSRSRRRNELPHPPAHPCRHPRPPVPPRQALPPQAREKRLLRTGQPEIAERGNAQISSELLPPS